MAQIITYSSLQDNYQKIIIKNISVMKQKYITILVTLFSLTAFSQAYEFSLQFNGTAGSGNFQFKLIATPDFDTTASLTSDMGVTIYIPSGYSLGNFATGNSNLQFYEWIVNGSVAINDQNLVSLVRNDVVQNSFTHTSGDIIELLLFEIINDGGNGNNPSSGAITLADNSDQNVIDNFYESFLNINIGVGTNDYFLQHDSSANSINFETLSTPENSLISTQLKVHPNPTSNFLSINTPAEVKYVEFYNLLGKKVYQTTQTLDIPTSQLANGLYLITIYTNKGQVTRKIVKK